MGKDPEDSRKRVYKPVVGEGRLRILSKDSIVEKGSFIVAEPITIDTRYRDEDPMRLLVMASVVDTTWLATNTPAQLNNFVKGAFDKARKPQSKSEDKQTFRRPGGPRRRRG